MAKDLYDGNGRNIADLAAEAAKWRDKFEIANVEMVDVVSILEFKIPRMWPGFHLKVVADKDISWNAKIVFSAKALVVRNSIYIGAANGDPRSRFILAHEIGHILLHQNFKNETLHDTDEEYEENIKKLNAKESAEDQATIFGRFFLAPPHIAQRYKHNAEGLSKAAKIPRNQAAASVTLSKRQELYRFRQLSLT